MTNDNVALEARLTKIEDQIAIYQVITGYNYGVDGLNAEAVGSCYTDDGINAVGNGGEVKGREAIEAITRDPNLRKLVAAGSAHMSSVPYIVIEGDRAVATCHTMVAMHREDGYFVGRLKASRLQLARQCDGGWKIVYRQNYALDGNPAASALLGQLQEGPEKV
jgi:uncharacterized protein (TIGR02246 family)